MAEQDEIVIERRFIRVGPRLVHYRTAGGGRPVVVLHDAPGSSADLETVIDHLALTNRVYAPDAPGHGLSESLAGEPGLAEYAQAYMALVDGLGVDRSYVIGVGVASFVAIALRDLASDRFPLVVVDETAVLDEGERAEMIESGFPPFEEMTDGSHVARAWHWARSRHMFSPPYRQTGDARLKRALPSAEWLHANVVELLRAGEHYADLAIVALGGQAAVGDALVVAAGDTFVDEVVDGMARAPLIDAAPALPPQPESQPGVISRFYADTPEGQLHVRQAGTGGVPLVMIHQSPGSAFGMEDLIREFSSDRWVLAPDTLGNGHSDKPSSTDTDAGYYADVVAAALDQLGIAQADVFGSHTGGLIAMELAIRRPGLVRSLGMDGITLFDPDFAADALANYFPSMDPDPHGIHLLRAWQVRQDMYLFWPWYRYTAEGAHARGFPDASVLKDWVDDLLTSGPTWRVAYRAAFEYPTRERLAVLTTPTLVATGEEDPLRPYSEEAAKLCDAIELAESAGYGSPEASRQTADVYRAFFARQP